MDSEEITQKECVMDIPCFFAITPYILFSAKLSHYSTTKINSWFFFSWIVIDVGAANKLHICLTSTFLKWWHFIYKSPKLKLADIPKGRIYSLILNSYDYVSRKKIRNIIRSILFKAKGINFKLTNTKKGKPSPKNFCSNWQKEYLLNQQFIPS